MHIILQNGRQLPRPLIIKLFDAIDEYNNSKQREDQRPRWGLHMTEAHVMAIADTPVPPDIMQDTAASAKAKAKAINNHQDQAPRQAQDLRPRLRRYVHQSQLVRRSNHQRHQQDAVEKTTERAAAATHIVAAIGTTLDTETDVGDNPD